MHNYHHSYVNTSTVQLKNEPVQYWDVNTQYYENEVVIYEGLRYSSLRMTLGEIPLLCISGAWEIYEGVPVANSHFLQEENTSYYGSAMEERDFLYFQHEEVVNSVLEQFNFKKIKAFNVSEEKIVSRLLLPLLGDEETVLSWESSTPKYLSHQGAVVRPSHNRDVPVWLKLTVTKAQISKSKVFEFWIKAKSNALELNEEESVIEALKAFSFNDFRGENRDIQAITKKLSFKNSALYGTTLTWLCMDKKLIGFNGELNTKSLKKDKSVKLYVLINKGKAQQHKRFFLKIKADCNAEL